MKLARAGNLHIDQSAPWALNKAGDADAVADSLHAALELCFTAAALLRPVMPAKMDELLAKLGRSPEDAAAWVRGALVGGGESQALNGLPAGAPLLIGEPLFQRSRELPEAIAALFAAPEPEPEAIPRKPPITFEDFAKLDLRAGRILSAEPHPKADKLMVLRSRWAIRARARSWRASAASSSRPTSWAGRWWWWPTSSPPSCAGSRAKGCCSPQARPR